eukprot:1129706-Rhodomonas_salina.3
MSGFAHRLYLATRSVRMSLGAVGAHCPYLATRSMRISPWCTPPVGSVRMSLGAVGAHRLYLATEVPYRRHSSLLAHRCQIATR